MGNRWKMNRMGFVNFWLYDEEIFSFADGKLLLRGQNGSGKSITTQSFIPFILDGDRTPSRLDPFGSSDRRMEFYFLGEEGKEESTGYLFLEFKKEETGQYRTIAIGQNARKGKPMGFWGFVVTDGRRIGYDIQLYEEAGSTKIPHDKQKMKKLLGENNPFTDVPGEYKKLVNKYLFGFRRTEQYDQFIRLLVKVRAPKLSKEFKPTKVYEILNESLQTLTDEDLRAMVDAMEKMDAIQGNLEHLGRAFSDIRIIRNEYTRYNQFMLAKKAQAYLERKAEVEREQAKLEEKKRQFLDFQEEETEKKEKQRELSQRENVIQAELDGLHEEDLEAAQERLERQKSEREEVSGQIRALDQDIEKSRERIREYDNARRRLSGEAEYHAGELKTAVQELSEQQEILLFDLHDEVAELLRREREDGAEGLQESLKERRKQIADGIGALRELEVALARYDEASQLLEKRRTEKEERGQELEDALEEEEKCRNALIEGYYAMAKRRRELVLSREELAELERVAGAYQGAEQADEMRRLLNRIYEGRRREIRLAQEENGKAERAAREELSSQKKQLAEIQNKPEVEPVRSPLREESRKRLTAAGIRFTPFYSAVEFSPSLTQEARGTLEAQLADAGLLDALVVAKEDQARMPEEFPQLSETMLRVDGDGRSGFERLTVNEELPEELRTETRRILSHICQTGEKGGALYLGADGSFQNGILAGRSVSGGDAEFVGITARRKKRERLIAELTEAVARTEQLLETVMREKEALAGRMAVLEEEYRLAPAPDKLNAALERVRQYGWLLQQAQESFQEAEKKEQDSLSVKNHLYQQSLQICRALPYGRTVKEYTEAQEAAGAYADIWAQARENLRELSRCRAILDAEKEKAEREEEAVDRTYEQKRRESNRLETLDASIRRTEEFLNDPENREKAEKVRRYKKEQKEINGALSELDRRLYFLAQTLQRMEAEKEREAERLAEMIGEEAILRKYFEEELSLGLIVKRESKTTAECAKEAVKALRDSDKGRNPEDLTTSLLKVYQQHNSNLTSYGTCLEDCFDEPSELPSATRKRQRIVSIWNGKRLYLDHFYDAIKAAIEETELLIREKDRELFEDILSKTLSRQLTDRIAESRRWVNAMSALMKQIDTSMGLKFSLDWKPKTAENEQELDTVELEKLLLRDNELLTREDMEKVALHFRSKIRTEKQTAEENGSAVNYLDLVRDALDYRKWFEFQMAYYRNDDNKKTLTNAAFNRFSGGEKAMAMYVPLFAAVNAQYQKASLSDCPRIVAMDEAFAGVDDKNISTMFELVAQLDFDYIMNSQALWGCYHTVPSLRISELLHPLDSQVVTVIHYTWNGHERVLDEQ